MRPFLIASLLLRDWRMDGHAREAHNFYLLRLEKKKKNVLTAYQRVGKVVCARKLVQKNFYIPDFYARI